MNFENAMCSLDFLVSRVFLLVWCRNGNIVDSKKLKYYFESVMIVFDNCLAKSNNI